jgi:hypothetical protein
MLKQKLIVALVASAFAVSSPRPGPGDARNACKPPAKRRRQRRQRRQAKSAKKSHAQESGRSQKGQGEGKSQRHDQGNGEVSFLA